MKGTCVIQNKCNIISLESVVHAMWYTQIASVSEYSQNKMALELIGLF